MDNVINLMEKLSIFEDLWSPKVIAEINDYQIKLVKIKGEFTWHKHDDTDELFYVIDGEIKIEMRDSTVQIKKGEMYVIKKGIEHRPVSENESKIMLIEPKGVVNTGDGDKTLKAENDVWI